MHMLSLWEILKRATLAEREYLFCLCRPNVLKGGQTRNDVLTIEDIVYVIKNKILEIGI